jgi:MoxR-like ATPase
MQQFARGVPIPPHVKEYAARLILATHPQTENAPETTRKYLRYGSSPRGCQTLISAAKVWALKSGKSNVGFEDIRKAVAPALRHRIILNFEGEAEGISPDDIAESVIRGVQELPEKVEHILKND